MTAAARRQLAKTVEMPIPAMAELMAELGGECQGLPKSHGPSTLKETQELPAFGDLELALMEHAAGASR